jgi:hypothetical protein
MGRVIRIAFRGRKRVSDELITPQVTNVSVRQKLTLEPVAVKHEQFQDKVSPIAEPNFVARRASRTLAGISELGSVRIAAIRLGLSASRRSFLTIIICFIFLDW